jgi:hypothetical protein
MPALLSELFDERERRVATIREQTEGIKEEKVGCMSTAAESCLTSNSAPGAALRSPPVESKGYG